MMDRSYSSGLGKPPLLGSRREEAPSSLLGFRRDAYVGSAGGGVSSSDSFRRTDWNSSKTDSFYQGEGLDSEYNEYGSFITEKPSRISSAANTALPGRLSYGQPERDNQYGSFITEKTSKISSAANTEIPGRMSYGQPAGDNEFNSDSYSTNFEQSFRDTGRPQPQSRFPGAGGPQSQFNDRNLNFHTQQTTQYSSNIQPPIKKQQGQRNQGAPKRKNRKQGFNQRPGGGVSMEQLRNQKEQQIKLEMMKMDEIRRQKQQELQQELDIMESIRKRKHEQMENEFMEQELRQRDMIRQSDERDFMEFQEFKMMKRMCRENEDRERSLDFLLDAIGDSRGGPSFGGPQGGPSFGGRQPNFNQFQGRSQPLLPTPRSFRGRSQPLLPTPRRSLRGRNVGTFGRNLSRPINQRMGQPPGKNWSPRGRNKNFPNQFQSNKRGHPKPLVQPQQKKKPADIPNPEQQSKKKKKKKSKKVKEEIPEKPWFCSICQVDNESEEKHKEHLETTKHKEAFDEHTKNTEKKPADTPKPADIPKPEQQLKKKRERPNLVWNVKEEIPEKFWFCGICQVDTKSEEKHDKHLETAKHKKAFDEDTKNTKKKLLNLLREYMNNHEKAELLETVKTVQCGAYIAGNTCMEELWKFIQYYCVACRLRFCTSAEFKEHKLTVSHIKHWRARLIWEGSVGVSLECPAEYNPNVSVGEEQIMFMSKRNCLVCDELLSWNEVWQHTRAKPHAELYKELLQKEAGSEDDAKDAAETADAK